MLNILIKYVIKTNKQTRACFLKLPAQLSRFSDGLINLPKKGSLIKWYSLSPQPFDVAFPFIELQLRKDAHKIFTWHKITVSCFPSSVHAIHLIYNVILSLVSMMNIYHYSKIQLQSLFFWKTIPICLVFTNHQKEKNLTFSFELSSHQWITWSGRPLTPKEFSGSYISTSSLHSLQPSQPVFSKFHKILSQYSDQFSIFFCSVYLEYSWTQLLSPTTS